MLAALYQIPKDKLREVVIWALGGEPVMRAPDPDYDPAALDKVVSDMKAPQ